MANPIDDADYDADGTFENVPSPLSDAGDPDNYYGRRLRTRCVLHSPPDNETKLRQRGQPIYIEQPILEEAILDHKLCVLDT
ncbi:unnamed protein product [Protopolystoma xenopodis]|uniref:Uncharacterized protein n=1 Tax=Protopolystoma xenopodis TaxID=117903 RepID=A0A3S5A662_9PLAT|nr:unnamed protein product [Protopolystoma xenopodis]